MPTHTRVTRTNPDTPHTFRMKGVPAQARCRKHDRAATATDKQHGMRDQEGCTPIDTSASMLHAALRHTTKSATITAPTTNKGV